MAEQDPTHLSPTSAVDDTDDNGVDSFPRLVETPATMSPVPSHERNQPPSATLFQQHPQHSKTASGERSDGQDGANGRDEADEDSSWSTDSDNEDDLNSLQAIAGSGTDPIDSRSIYHALFGGGAGRDGDIGAGGLPQRSLGAQAARRLPQLPVYKLALGRNDVDSCVKLEEACFPDGGASRDDLTYRIAQASGLNIGLFTTAYAQSDSAKLPTYETSSSSETTSNRRAVLVAYINATLTTNDRISKEDVMTPKNWQSPSSQAADGTDGGHQPYGRTVVVHSFGVLPELQCQNLGTCLWKTFLQIIKGSKHYTRVAIAVPTSQVAWFKKHKLRTLGSSALKASNDAVKVDMVIDYHEDDDSDEDEEEDEDSEGLGPVYDHDTLSDEDDDDSEAAEDQLMHEAS